VRKEDNSIDNNMDDIDNESFSDEDDDDD